MAKKVFFVMVFLAFCMVSAFAQPEFKVSAGFGGYLTGDFGGGVEAKVSGIRAGDLKTPYFGGGAFVFLDATFIELNLGIFGAGGDWEEYGYGVGTVKYDASLVGLDIGLMGKYPITINNQLSLFPLLGITYRIILSAELDDVEADEPGDLSALWFKFGGGMDYSFTEKIYLRAGIVYGLRLENQFEKDMEDYLNSVAGGAASINNLLGHGLEIKLGIGFKF